MAIRLLHITLAFLALFSSSGLLINQHYCQNELKHSALFAPAERCHKAAVASCPMHAAPQGEKKGCCDDKSHFLKHKQEIVQGETELIKAPVPVVLTPLAALSCAPIHGDLAQRTIHYLNYKPPLITYDLPVRFQSFLL